MVSTRLSAAVLGLALAACTAPSAGKAEPGSELAQKAERLSAVRVIARLAAEPAAAGAVPATVAALTDMQTMGVQGATALSESLPYVVAEVSAEQLKALEANPRFDLVVEDRIAVASLADSTKLIEAPQVWALGGRGAGQSVAILDTGVDASHPFLAGRVNADACFSTTSPATGAQSVCPNGLREEIAAGAARPCNAAGCEHGTHVAGIAAGRGAQFSGVAPDAQIIPVQVFSRFVDSASGPTPCRDSGQRSPCIASFTSDQIRGLDYVRRVAATRAVASANMSLGGGRSSGACDTDVTKPVIDQLRAAGVATVIAAGNDGFAESVSFPGCISTAVTVGSTTKTDGVSSFSNRGPVLDLYAPGSSIASSVPGGTFSTFSGTSMAAPHVAGAFAALKSARPGASLADIERAFASTGVTVDRRPRIAMLRALQALPAQVASETPMVAIAGEPPPQGLTADIATLPADRFVRVIVKPKVAPGATPAATQSAIKRVTDAAHMAGAALVEPVAGQPLVVVEAKPAALAALMRSGAAESIQMDRAARPQ